MGRAVEEHTSSRSGVRDHLLSSVPPVETGIIILVSIALVSVQLAGFIGQFGIGLNSDPSGSSFRFQVSETNCTAPCSKTVSISGMAYSTGPIDNTLVGARAAVPRDVYVYYDPSYPLAVSSTTILNYDIYLIGQFLSERGSGGVEVSLINSTHLVELLRSPPTSLVVFATGVLPLDVLSPTTNLLTPWMLQGGDVMWAGLPPGYLEAAPGEGLSGVNTHSLLYNGQLDLLNYSLVNPLNQAAHTELPS